MSGDPVVYKESGCPVCQGDLMATPGDEGSFHAETPFFCTKGCGYHGILGEDADGDLFLQPSDAVASLTDLLIEARKDLEETMALLLKVHPFIPQTALDKDRYRDHKASESWLQDTVRRALKDYAFKYKKVRS